jgi:dolichyl-phosphate-mannose-protein mannosyltransferase
MLRARLAAPVPRAGTAMPHDGIWGWIWPLLVTGFGGYLRFNRLVVPRVQIFDESVYPDDAWSILHHGVEWNLSTNAFDLVLSGGTNIWATCTHAMYVGDRCGENVTQPELGKELIAVGEAIFGLDPFGWRFSSAVFGTLAILLICRIARRMTRSTLLGCIAGLLMSLDGLEFVLSRTGMLDIYLMFFVLAAFGCMVVDRDVTLERLAAGPSGDAGPRLGIRRWRVAAGICVGLAIAVKWDAIWYLLGLAILGICWDAGARRAAGLPSRIRDTFSWLPLTYMVIPLVVYVATWSDWLFTSTGYLRNYAAQHGVHIPVISALYSLFEYQKSGVLFGYHLGVSNSAQSQPWDWLLMTRPPVFYYACYTTPTPNPAHFCENPFGAQWSQEVLAIGTPAIWWGSILALIACLGWWLLRRDWRAGAVLCGVIAGWLPWFPLVHRTKYFYYALEFEPFLILAITVCLGLIIGQASASLLRRATGFGLAGAYLVVVLLMFLYFYPVLAGKTIPYSDWLAHMWFTNWYVP